MRLVSLPLLLELRVALRNVLRHRRRTFLALVTIVGGITAYLLAGGFIEWIFSTMRETTIHSQLGHIQIVRPQYFEKGVADPYRYLLPEDPALMKRIEESSQAATVTPRLAFSGLISHGEATVSFLGEGVVPSREVELSRWLLIVAGRGLADDDRNGIVLGEGLAANLGVVPGDTVVLLGTSAKGALSAVECHVAGIFTTAAKAYDDVALRVPLAVAQSMVRTTGATSWVVLLDKTERTDAVLALLKHAQYGQSLQFVGWHELADFYNKTVSLFSKQVNVVKLIIALIIILSISNTLSMAVMERTSEIGTIMAVGSRRSDVLRAFLLEGTTLGVAGGMFGLVLSVLLAWLISSVGIPMPPPPGMAHGFTGQIILPPHLLLDAFVLAVGTTLIASLLPAWRASRMNIVDALRHQR